MLGQQGDGGVVRGIGELLISLVDDDHGRGPLTDLVDDRDRNRGSGGIVRGGDEHHGGMGVIDGLHRVIDVETEPSVPLGSDVARMGVPGIFGIHGIRRSETQNRSSRSGEDLQDLHHDLIGTIGCPHLGGVDPETDVVGQVLAQSQRLPVRVPVEGLGRLGHGPGHLASYRGARWVRILVDVERYGHLERGSPVGLLADELVTQRKIGQGDRIDVRDFPEVALSHGCHPSWLPDVRRWHWRDRAGSRCGRTSRRPRRPASNHRRRNR